MKRSILAVLYVAGAVAPMVAAQDSLASLIQLGNRKAALEKIRAGADVNEAQPDGTRPIHWAVFRVDHELAEALIAKKANVDVSNEFGSTPLAEAAKLADSGLVKMLLDAGAKPDAANLDGETAFMLAIKTGELPVVQMMLNAGANVNVIERFHHQTPLMWAAAAPRNAGEMVKLLLAKGADVKARATYLDWPSQISSEPRAQYRPVGGLTPLLYAARAGCTDCVDALIVAGADANVPTPEGVTPLMIAIDGDHLETANLLLDRGANPHLADWWGRTALYIAVDRKEIANGAGGRGGPAPVATRVNMDLINRLLDAGVDPNPELNIHRPSRGGNSGRFADNQLSTGATPLFRATLTPQGPDEEVIQVLLEIGASPNIKAMGFTPFLVAAGVSPGGRGAAGGGPNTALLDLMILHGADVNAQVTGTKTNTMLVSRPPSNNEGMSALHAAAQAGRAELVRYLLEKGVNPELTDSEGRRAIDLAGVNAGGRGGGAAAAANAVSAAEIRGLLENAAARNRSAPPVSR